MPLFESCEDSQVFRSVNLTDGAVYNDFDGIGGDLLDDSDFEESSQLIDNNDESFIESSNIETPEVEQEDLDFFFLQADEVEDSRWKKNHRLFLSEHSYEYDEIVKSLVEMNNEEWGKLPINTHDIERSVEMNYTMKSLFFFISAK